jgi:histidinol phosphatase-like PHP family hydrolase
MGRGATRTVGRGNRPAHRAVDKTFGKDFRIFKGVESDILADGSLDYPDDSADLPGQVRAAK